MSVPYDAATAPGLGRLVLLTLGTAIGAHVLSLVAATVAPSRDPCRSRSCSGAPPRSWWSRSSRPVMPAAGVRRT